MRSPYRIGLIATPFGTSLFRAATCQHGLPFVLLGMIAIACHAQPPAMEWGRAVGGPGDQEAFAVAVTPDGGYVLAGQSLSGVHDRSYFLAMVDSAGTTSWSHIWTDTLSNGNYELFESVVVVPDSGIVAVGAYTALAAMRVNFDGTANWLTDIHAQGLATGETKSSVIASDGLIVIPAIVGWSGEYRGAVIKLSLEGDTVWTRTHLDQPCLRDQDIQLTADAGFVVAGYSQISTLGAQMTLAKMDSNGELIWTQDYGDSYTDVATSVCTTIDGGYALAGYTSQQGYGVGDLRIIRTDAFGAVRWDCRYVRDGLDYAAGIIETDDHGFLLAGSTWMRDTGYNFDAYLVRTDSLGNVLWTATYGGPNYDAVNDMKRTSDGGCVLVGKTRSFGANGADCLLIKLSAEDLATGPTAAAMPNGMSVTVYPNPFNMATTIAFTLPHSGPVKLSLFDVLGRQVMYRDIGNVTAGTTLLPFNAAGLPSGNYVARVIGAEASVSTHVVLIK